MSEIVEKINTIIMEEKIESLWDDANVYFVIEVKEIDNTIKMEESFKKYIDENDKTDNVNWNDYVIYEITDIQKDVYDTIKSNQDDFGLRNIMYSTDNIDKINKIIQLLKDNKAKSYKLAEKNNSKGEYRLYDVIYGGEIRCVETDDTRFIISFRGYD